MVEYVVIAGDTYPVNTEEECKAAARVLSREGINSAEVWRSPAADIGSVVENGDPDAVKTHFVLLADTNVDPVANGTQLPSSETNNEGLTWPEWAAAAGCYAHGEGILRDEWRAGVDPTEYRANPQRRDLLAGVVARQSTRGEAEDWVFNHVSPTTGWQIVLINDLWCVVKPAPDGSRR